jgi:hypothetical protein
MMKVCSQSDCVVVGGGDDEVVMVCSLSLSIAYVRT